jgi:hypothetical protein
MMLLSCREARQCLHLAAGCICDGDPTMVEPDVIDELDRIHSACTQKTFLHSPDWREGHKIIQTAIAEIKKLRAERDLAAAQVENVFARLKDIDAVMSAIGVATTQTEVEPTRRHQAHMKIVEFLNGLRTLALSSTERTPISAPDASAHAQRLPE